MNNSDLTLEETKVGAILVYNEIITYINYINHLVFIENIKNDTLDELMYLLNHLKYNCNLLINILKNERLNGFFEITRCNIELLCILKYFLIDKTFVEERVLTYNFFKIKESKKKLETMSTFEDSYLKDCRKYNLDETESKKKFLEFTNRINTSIDELNKEINSSRFDKIRTEVILTDTNKTKFYNYYNSNCNTFRDLCTSLENELLYNGNYHLTSKIVHGSDINIITDKNLLFSTTLESNSLFYDVFKQIIIFYLKDEDYKNLKVWGKQNLGVNFTDS